MGCNCGKPKCDGKCGISPAVLQINNPSECVIFHKVDVPASMGDSTTNPPKTGAYKNVLLYYEADQTSWLYSSDGIPVRLTNGITNYEDAINLPSVNGVTLLGDKSSADLKLADAPMVITIASGNAAWSGADTAEDIYNFFLNQGKVTIVFEGSENYGYEIISAAYIPGEQKMMCMVAVASIDPGSSPVGFAGNALYGLMTFYTAGKVVDVGEIDLQPKLFVTDFTGLNIIDGNVLEGVPATSFSIGMVKPGDGLEVDADGKLTVINHVFDTVADMKASTGLVNGAYAQTFGYYTKDDGGRAKYKISSDIPSGYYETLDSGLYAELIEQDNLNVKQFGAKGDGTTDDTTAIQNAVDYAFSHNTEIHVPASNAYYKVTMPIILKNNVDSGGIGGYWFGKSSKVVGDNRGTTKIVKVGVNTYVDYSIAFVNNVNSVFICANQNGTGITIEDLTLANYETFDGSTGTFVNTSYGIYGNVSRSTLKNLNIRSYKGIYWSGFSNLFDNIAFGCTESAFENTNGTSNTFRFLYATNCLNPFKITSQYSTMLNCATETCTGIMYYVNGSGLSLIDCGSESPKAQYIFKTDSQFSTLTINNASITRQSGDSDSSLALTDCAVCYLANEVFINIDGLSIIEQNYIDTTDGNSSIFKSDNANRKVTTTLKNIRYTKNYTGTDNEPCDLWGSNVTRYCTQTLSTPTTDVKYFVGADKSIIPYIGGTDCYAGSRFEGGKALSQTSVGSIKKIWLDTKSQYETENGTNLKYTGRHNIGDIQLFNDPLARNALGLSTISVGTESWGVKYIPIVLTGSTANRPTTNLFDGLLYFDTTLHKPVWYFGGYWWDATGANV